VTSGQPTLDSGYGDNMEVGLQDWYRALTTLVRGGHTVQASGLAPLLNQTLRPIGLNVIVYLADAEQRALRAVPAAGTAADALPIEGSLAGRSFMTVTPLVAARDPGRLWMPLVDGTERLGVLDIALPAGMDPDNADVRTNIDAVAGLLAHLVVAKTQYGDTLSRARRSQQMSPGAETLWRLLPPLTFTTDRLVLSAILEPCYAVGGDVYDYAVDNDVARIAMFDAVGHGLPAALTATVALGASRSARIQGHGLHEVGRAVDRAILDEFGDSRFLTAVLAELHLETGTLRYVNAGHPPPVLMRGGKAVAQLRVEPRARRPAAALHRRVH
jgi:sigma-B regulation protein RsbU (phosphoserine phosphatase)